MQGISGRGEQSWLEWALEIHGAHVCSGDLCQAVYWELGNHVGKNINASEGQKT